MAKKLTKESDKFILSKEAQEYRAEFARKADPSIVLKYSCDQTKLEVLIHQKDNKEVIMWLLKHIKRSAKISPRNGSYSEEDAEQDLYTEIQSKTIPRLIESGNWIFWRKLNSYLGKAINNFLKNIYYKNLPAGWKKEYKNVEFDENAKPRPQNTGYLEILLDTPFTKRQKQIMISLGDGATYKQVAKELNCSTSTVQKERREIAKDKDFYEHLKSNKRF
jgi:hypothetical protein